MANKRELKKEINYICEELISQTLTSKSFVNASDDNKVDELLGRIFEMQKEYISRVCHPNGTKRSSIVKEYYREIIKKLDNEIGDIIIEIGTLNR